MMLFRSMSFPKHFVATEVAKACCETHWRVCWATLESGDALDEIKMDKSSGWQILEPNTCHRSIWGPKTLIGKLRHEILTAEIEANPTIAISVFCSARVIMAHFLGLGRPHCQEILFMIISFWMITSRQVCCLGWQIRDCVNFSQLGSCCS